MISFHCREYPSYWVLFAKEYTFSEGHGKPCQPLCTGEATKQGTPVYMGLASEWESKQVVAWSILLQNKSHSF